MGFSKRFGQLRGVDKKILGDVWGVQTARKEKHHAMAGEKRGRRPRSDERGAKEQGPWGRKGNQVFIKKASEKRILKECWRAHAAGGRLEAARGAKKAL